MIFPVITDWRISSPFDEQRPLNANEKTHLHGAIDIACDEGTDIYAPENGRLLYYVALRTGKMTQNLYWPASNWFAFSNYFYDTFGGLIILEGEESGLTHVFAHINAESLFRNEVVKNENMLAEEKQSGDAVCVTFSNREHPALVIREEKIGVSGNAGFSTGPHIHYEIHRGRRWEPHGDRVNPKSLYTELKGGRV